MNGSDPKPIKKVEYYEMKIDQFDKIKLRYYPDPDEFEIIGGGTPTCKVTFNQLADAVKRLTEAARKNKQGITK
jgi:hypothetical protein